MTGWRIFVHSVRMVVDNLGTALRLSLVLYLVQVAAQVQAYMGPVDPAQLPDDMAPGLTQLVLTLLAAVASLWIAVGWHRFVLTGEPPAGLLPRWHGSAILSYLWRSIKIGLLIVLALMVAGLVVTLVALALGPQVAAVFGFGLVGLGSFLFFRMGLVLPAAALGQPLAVREAWRATKRDDGAVITLAFLVIGGSLLIELPAMIDGGSATTVSLIYGVVVNWFATMIGISILTSLYGHFIEGRPID